MGSGGFHQSHMTKKIEGEEDPVEKMIADTGCLELHNEVQSCIFETGDWRKCQKHVQNFRKCIEEYNKKKSGEAQ